MNVAPVSGVATSQGRVGSVTARVSQVSATLNGLLALGKASFMAEAPALSSALA